MQITTRETIASELYFWWQKNVDMYRAPHQIKLDKNDIIHQAVYFASKVNMFGFW